ncbi:hypothetical protein [Leptolyngbya ohadii]|uniref:hypothetical protein n=1 Tax=Leptolyngbya ohadii TaxID=1962290 RepID=UPI000B59DE18|nr:hypothetical protein [Leptolyngbya ohadii]
MSFFNLDTPVISKKKSALEIPPAPGLLKIHWQVGRFTIHSSFYTKHDQACLLWSILSGSIFVMAQFLPVSWITQAIFASAITLTGIAGMVYLTWYLRAERRLAIVLYAWIGLMLTGAIVTDLSIIFSWLPVLMNICALWLSLSAIGYLITAVGMRSRAFFLAAMLHLLAIQILPYVAPWQSLITGIVIGFSVYLIAELQWDSNGVCGYQVELGSGGAEEEWMGGWVGE